MRTALILMGALAAACGGDDSGGPAGSGGASSGGAGGASGGNGGTAAGGAAGASGGSGGSVTGGTAGSSSGGAAGSSSLCSATSKPFADVDCSAACQHFVAWGPSGACANPYGADCTLACDTVKNGLTYVNVLFGCAAQESDCSAFQQCMATYCG
jgi:hypothetical protein